MTHVLMIIWTMATAANGTNPVAISQTATLTTAAVCSQVKKETAMIDRKDGRGKISLPELDSGGNVQVTVKCISVGK